MNLTSKLIAMSLVDPIQKGAKIDLNGTPITIMSDRYMLNGQECVWVKWERGSIGETQAVVDILYQLGATKSK